MNARVGRPIKGGSKGEDSIFVATHLSGLKVRSIVAFKSPPAPARKDPTLRGSAKKGTNQWNHFLSEKMDVRTPASRSSNSFACANKLLQEVTQSHPGLKKPELLKIVAQMWKEQKAAAGVGGAQGSPDGSAKQSVGSGLSDVSDSDSDDGIQAGGSPMSPRSGSLTPQSAPLSEDDDAPLADPWLASRSRR